MASRWRQGLQKDFIKLRHKSSVFTASNVALLKGALDMSDLVSMAFLMCGDDQIPDMCELFSSATCQASLDLYALLTKFPEWERKLPEALGAIKNDLALMKIGISPKDTAHNRRIKDSELALCPARVGLYRIIDELPQEDGRNLVARMEELGAPKPPVYPHLGKIAHEEFLHFMFWHSQGFLSIPSRRNFETVAASLRSIGRRDLADYFTVPEVLHDSYVFDDHPLGVYDIKNPNSPGLCVVVNQVRYGVEERDRDSSIVNAEDLISLMTALNFSVVLLEDLSEREFCKRIKTVVGDGFSAEHSIFVLVIMGHGGPDGVHCAMEKPKHPVKDNLAAVPFEDIQRALFECHELETLPKVLIFNACRGKYEFTTRSRLVADGPEDRDAASHVDMITCYSALPKFVSWRDHQKGSLFINVFCDILRARPDMEICELFTLMNARLMNPTPDMSQAFEHGRKGHEKRIGMPFDFTSSLTKQLYFRLPETFRTPSVQPC